MIYKVGFVVVLIMLIVDYTFNFNILHNILQFIT